MHSFNVVLYAVNLKQNHALLDKNFLFRLSFQIKPLDSTIVFMTEKCKRSTAMYVCV